MVLLDHRPPQGTKWVAELRVPKERSAKRRSGKVPGSPLRRSLLSEVDGELTGDFLRKYLLPSDFRFLLMPCLIEIGCDDEAEGYISHSGPKVMSSARRAGPLCTYTYA